MKPFRSLPGRPVAAAAAFPAPTAVSPSSKAWSSRTFFTTASSTLSGATASSSTRAASPRSWSAPTISRTILRSYQTLLLSRSGGSSPHRATPLSLRSLLFRRHRTTPNNSTFSSFFSRANSNASPASKSPNPNPTPHLGSPSAPAPSFSQRMRTLSREYGWVALGVYLGLSVLDFPFCFLAVRSLGVERIGRWEHAVVEAFWGVVRVVAPDAHTGGSGGAREDAGEGAARTEDGRGIVDGAMMDIEEAERANAGSEATIWTQLALAYAIHKSFIFFRVPLTAAVTPKVVKVLRSWGWNIGKKKPKKP